ncbi:LLM class flavin-dependent oxidoreductase [Bradyrhizobium sp. LTSP885]|uniref:LLM class flavin-dependent oxidoreductase n=1 Tax=Bradyrhizobium sp. LTSP885 TaxID=1619232 RepID=UPI000A7403D4|nr:LLM class flavin-dependent oxidoreductase [Bradyrhizobium sp. LTSP885]
MQIVLAGLHLIAYNCGQYREQTSPLTQSGGQDADTRYVFDSCGQKSAGRRRRTARVDPSNAMRDAHVRLEASTTKPNLNENIKARTIMKKIPLRHGIFLAPFHDVEEDPSTCLQRDLELVELVERLGYEEAWVGEHHSAGFEMIASPELFIAAAAERTRRIYLGTGVVSLPYHNPFMVAQRIIQLDHMTRGRVIFGAGPGLLTSDALMIGLTPEVLRDRLVQGLDVILRLFAGETVTEKTDWYNLWNARLHLMPYTYPYPEVCVASAVTPSGGRVAGKYGLGLICMAATNPNGFDALGTNWKIACDLAEGQGNSMDPGGLRLVAPMHIAETRDQARKNVMHGIEKWLDYRISINPTVPLRKGSTIDEMIDNVIQDQGAVIGTPDDAIAKIEGLYGKQGQFGALLISANDWANWENSKKSYELYARFVRPHFSGTNRNRVASLEWVRENARSFGERSKNAQRQVFEKHEAELARSATENEQKPGLLGRRHS